MPRASDKIAAAEVTLLLRSRRQASTKSAGSESNHKMTLILTRPVPRSQVAFAVCAGRPKLKRRAQLLYRNPI